MTFSTVKFAVCIKYDRRSLLDLDAEGSYIALAELFFSSPALYREPADAEA